eukprot:CAMPEP_0116878106 /NCGR_PEP_ID=MMETSP0463-20121206/9843_1 /TAXON_ID=181622 /ORGANISM="Strombidinopsis sp, Strain SopsisLIS2011" /LENGTH=74 /DNA_ID=CAMNT_0004525969 /DNA_START=1691 /DNA_END=1915 /DNA_ORIENTATION=-
MLPKLTELVLKVFAVDQLMQDSTVLYETGYFSQGMRDMLEEGFEVLMKEMRPHMIPMIEIIGVTDHTLLSAIGN